MLEQERKKIDSLDREIVKLLEERMDVVGKIAEIKKVEHISILDKKREEVVLKKVASYVKNPEYLETITSLYKELMHTSKQYQAKQAKL